MKIGTLEGTNISRTELFVTADFSIPADEPVGTKDVSLEFAAPGSAGFGIADIHRERRF
ncbi:MAG: hypothetical protein GY749_32285 [Desulfobacteraceae bacterium]|nr:hypothetical protein [Desulfobacteraceae bacterium]